MSTSTQYHIYGSIQSHFVFIRPETESNFTYEYSGAYKACSVANGKRGTVGRPDDHHALLLSALYAHTIFFD